METLLIKTEHKDCQDYWNDVWNGRIKNGSVILNERKYKRIAQLFRLNGI